MENTDDPLVIGEILPNNGIVLKYYWRFHRSGEEPGKHGILLAFLPANPFHHFVVWGFFKRDSNGQVVCLNGDYIADLSKAVRIFSKRCGYMFMKKVPS